MKIRIWPALCASFIALLLTACSGLAEKFSVNSIYTDHMVLQRDVPIAIYGKADHGRCVNVEFAGKTVKAEADHKSGEWKAEFPAMKAGGPFELKISGKDPANDRIIRDILIGEVWICSGQSNMEMPVDSGRPFWRVKDCAKETANANYPQIRLFNVRKATSPAIAKNTVSGSWEVCSPSTVKPFSAAGYFFGRTLYQDLKVPVGLINASWGGTRIEPWIPEDTFVKAKRHEAASIAAARLKADEQAKLIEKGKQEIIRKFDAWQKSFDNFAPEKTEIALKTWKHADYADSSWQKAVLPCGFPEGIDGVAWFRLAFSVPQDLAGKDAVLYFGAIDDCDETYFNGELIGKTTTKTEFYWSFKRIYKIPGRLVKAGRNVIAVRVTDYCGEGGLMHPDLIKFVSGKKTIKLSSGWKTKVEFAADLKKIGSRPTIPAEYAVSSPQFPATLYNAMVHAWTKYPVRGAIWYQGCANAGSMDYYPLHKLLIRGWRDAWKDPAMPFIITQLSGFQRHTPKQRPPEDSWKKVSADANAPYALTREIQAEMLTLPNTGLAVCIDHGDQFDIHPGNKQIVGFRLAKEAERLAYGSKSVTSGPRFSGVKFEFDKAIVSFTNTGKGLKTSDGKAPGAFAIAGADGKYVWADKTEIKGNTVIVQSSKVNFPKYVRYAWVQYRGDVNLCNAEGFPAIPFRSDRPVYK